MAYHQTHYPKHRILSNISLDLAFALIVNLVVVLRFIQQRRLSLSVGHIIGNVAIGTSAIIITCWVAFSTYERVVYIKWAEAPASGILNQDGINTSTSSMKLYWLAGFLYLINLWLIKTAFLSTYFRVVKKAWVRYSAAAYVASSFIVCVLTHSLWCRPVSLNWSDEDYCSAWYGLVPLTIMTAANVTSDFVILLTPFMLLHTLQLRRSEKLAVVLVYVVGALSPMASLLRYEFIRKGFGTNPDSSDEFALDEVIKVWTTVEYSTAAIAFCLPSLRGILRRSLVGLVDAVRPRDERFMLENSYVPVVGEDDDEREKIW